MIPASSIKTGAIIHVSAAGCTGDFVVIKITPKPSPRVILKRHQPKGKGSASGRWWLDLDYIQKFARLV